MYTNHHSPELLAPLGGSLPDRPPAVVGAVAAVVVGGAVAVVGGAAVPAAETGTQPNRFQMSWHKFVYN